jgi:hypothetical protein
LLRQLAEEKLEYLWLNFVGAMLTIILSSLLTPMDSFLGLKDQNKIIKIIKNQLQQLVFHKYN